MHKRSIIIKSGTINSNWLLPKLQEYFDVQSWNADQSYTNKDILWQDILGYPQDTTDQHIDWKGPRIIERLWDEYVDEQSVETHNTLSLCMSNWIRFNESLYYKYLGYDKLFATPGGCKFFLMLMNKRRPHRTKLFNAVRPYLDYSLYSYCDLGHFILGDDTTNLGDWWKYCNIDWYNQTQFSVVSESNDRARTWISEKTYKPLAFGHAFIVHGSVGILELVKKQGFMTFDHIVDESYDTMTNPHDRFCAVTAQLELLHQNRDQGLFLDSESQARIKHNHKHFFNDSVINQIFLDEFITPIMEFLE